MDGVIPIGSELVELADEESVAFDHDLRVARFHGEHEVVVIVASGDPGEFEGTFDHAFGGIPVAVHDPVAERTVVGADAHGTAQIFTQYDEGGKFLVDAFEFSVVLVVGVFAYGELLFVGIVAGVDADFLDPFGGFEGGFGFEVDIGDDGDVAVLVPEFLDDMLEVSGVFDRGGCDADELGACGDEFEGFLDAEVGVHGVAGDHGLDDDGVVASDGNASVLWVTDDDFAGESAGKGVGGWAVAHGGLWDTTWSDGSGGRGLLGGGCSRGILLGCEVDFFGGGAFPREVLYVEDRDVEHISDNEEGAGALEDGESSVVDGFTSGAFDEGEQDMAAVEDGDGQEVEEGEVDIEDDAKPQGLAPAVFVGEEHVINTHDADESGKVLGLDIRFWGKEGLESIHHRHDAGGDLFHGAGVVDRVAAAEFPLDSDEGTLLVFGHIVGVDGFLCGDLGGESFLAAFDFESDGLSFAGFLDVVAEGSGGEEGGSVDFEDDVIGSDTCGGCGAIGHDLGDERGLFGFDADLSEGAAFVDFGFFAHESRVELDSLAVAFEFDGDGISGAGDHAPGDTIADTAEAGYRVAVDLGDFVTWEDAGFGCGGVGVDVTDGGGGFGFTDGASDAVDDEGEEDGEGEAEERSGEGDDDFIESRDGGEVFLGFVGFAFDGFHGGHLGEGDEAAGGDGSEGVDYAVDLFLPEGFTEPDGEFFHLKAAPAGGEEVSQFVDEDEEVKEEYDLQDDESDLQYLHR
ncbi:MAG: hypothetical protein RI897_3140 [Verrucomicrobiota bacterium]